ncbi:hypothetical protein [Amycolatopsis sp. lyj-84]
MTAQVRIWVATDDSDPRGSVENEDTVFVPEQRRPVENDFAAEHIILGYN